ncbi:S-layer homology domain-containing protein [Caldisericum exile]|nr:S-layer homology domain-containing protein [Caldisericum exile]
MKKILVVFLVMFMLFTSMFEGKSANLPLVGKVVTDRNEYALNETVRFLYTITNTSDSPITLKFNTSQIYDFVVMKGNTIIFKWGIDRMFAQVITEVTVPAHGTRAFSVSWDMVDTKGNKVGVGTYTVKFYLVNNYGVEATTNFTIGTPSFTPVFPDVNDYYVSKYLKILVDKGIVKGYPDNTFRSDSNLTRAEATVLILRTLEITPKNYPTSSFSDVSITYWAHNYIEEGVKRGIVKGISSDQFAPTRVISRGEFVTLLMRALSLTKPDAVSPFSDVSYTYFGYKEIGTAFDLNIIQGTVSNMQLMFYPNDPIKRKDAVLILARAVDVKK